MLNDRYILCRPDAGLNDMLIQIELMHRYARQTGRILVVDTAYTHAFCFRDHFSHYFQTGEKDLILDAREITPFLDGMTVFPECLAGRVNSYRPVPNPKHENLVDSETGNPLTFDLRFPYDHQLLVHHSFGGPDLALFCLTKLQVSDGIVDALFDRIEAIGAPFSGIHIRNTDIRTDYISAIQNIIGSVIRPVFIATDSLECRDYCIHKFGDREVRYFSILPENGRAIHYLNDYITSRQRNLDAILDLLTLALSTRFHRISLDGTPTGPVRGYTLLAEHLTNHDGVVLSMLGTSQKAISILKRATDWRQSFS